MVSLTKIKFMTDRELRSAILAEGSVVADWGQPNYFYLSDKEPRPGYVRRYVGSLNRQELRSELALIRTEYFSFHTRVEHLNQLEFKIMEKRVLGSLLILEEAQEAIKNSNLSVLLLDQAQAALEAFRDNKKHALELSYYSDNNKVPAYYLDFDSLDFEEKMIEYLKGPGSAVLYTWVVITMRHNHGGSLKCRIGNIEHLSERDIASFTQLGNIQVLIESSFDGHLPSFCRALRVHKRYLKIPLTALSYFEHEGIQSFVDAQGLTDSDIEAIAVLHGGDAYKHIADAAEAAINLR